MIFITEFVMLIGLPGSGKSYLANEYATKGFRIHSSDAIREELTGDVNNQRKNADVFQILHSRIKSDLCQGRSCVYDATNIDYKRRRHFLQFINDVDCHKEAVVICTPYEQCLVQNEARERKVPESVIERMYRNFHVPYYYEGWDTITLHYADDAYKTLYGSTSTFIFDTMSYCQDNPHHTATLGEHCLLASSYLSENYVADSVLDTELSVLAEAAFLHDNGKPFCKVFQNKKGEPTAIAHYYDHHNVGGYNALFYDLYSDDKLYLAVLIMWHMQMYFSAEGTSSYEKYQKLWGPKLHKDLLWLHKADLSAH